MKKRMPLCKRARPDVDTWLQTGHMSPLAPLHSGNHAPSPPTLMTHVPSTTHASHPCLLPCDHTSSALTHASPPTTRLPPPLHVAAASTCCCRHRLRDASDDLLLAPIAHHERELGPQDLWHTRASATAVRATSVPRTLSRNAAVKPVNRKYASTENRRSHMHQDVRCRINALQTVQYARHPHTQNSHRHAAPLCYHRCPLCALVAVPMCPRRRPYVPSALPLCATATAFTASRRQQGHVTASPWWHGPLADHHHHAACGPTTTPP